MITNLNKRCHRRKKISASERASTHALFASMDKTHACMSEHKRDTRVHVQEFVSSSRKYHYIYLHLRHHAWWITYVECNLYLFVPLYAVNIYISREISPWPPDLANNWCGYTHMVSHKRHQQSWQHQNLQLYTFTIVNNAEIIFEMVYSRKKQKNDKNLFYIKI